MKLDWKKLRTDAKMVVGVIKEMKVRKRESGHPRWNGLDELALIKAKKEATVFCSIAANARSRLHLTKRWSERDHCFYPLSVEDQQKLIGEAAKKYLIPDELDVLIKEEQARQTA